jgi:hypothetical protein
MSRYSTYKCASEENCGWHIFDSRYNCGLRQGDNDKLYGYPTEQAALDAIAKLESKELAEKKEK